ncbi:MAG: crossover junction endodeoxyribonuclease RuvC [Bacteroidales bacterium]|nr:crossover junction endodeoxyribonuclease RuvC [Bacteroidales bacterium]MCB9027838.1 crossover junction endodeoxyribonuclease RuvC [Bacteroidales bacterium]NLD63436.1 crossover junction endodeoxyribonuclease RuvC [Bacteroidales bacterium]HNT92831.1 crossover junction endodeoxyribonuclease RuvC [Bacteroidales bacterium]HOO66062.1 crossover junction endodeoxyribonuclease RuvC [Bacteroidales bacterium]
MKSEEAERIILGIDPGTTVTGYGLIKVTGRNPSLITLGIIDLRKKEDHFKKIRTIFEQTLELIDHYHPDEFAIEAPFFGKNVQSMLKLGRAQGAAIAAALYRDLPVFEYAPRMIKVSITGRGQASKEQVAAMLKTILSFRSEKMVLDATDALGAALCHFYQSCKPAAAKEYRNWSDFIRKNSDRLKG